MINHAKESGKVIQKKNCITPPQQKKKKKKKKKGGGNFVEFEKNEK